MSLPHQSAQPVRWAQSSEEAVRFWSRLRSASRSLLMLDYDGTLAPFRNDPLDAFPYPGVMERLNKLARVASVRLVIVSGRPVAGLTRFLGETMGVEIWGDHGWEHRRASGEYELARLTDEELHALRETQHRMEQLGFAHSVESKPASLAVHWRGLDPAARSRLENVMKDLAQSLPRKGRLRLVPFDGGVELRSPARNKGDAVNSVLGEEPPGLPAAYLGDDLTDEDAFRALAGRGVTLLVRSEPRQTLGDYWIKPPDDLLRFLDQWLAEAP